MSQGRGLLQIFLPVICDVCSSLPPDAPLPAKVTVNYYEEEGSMPIDQAGLFLTAIGKWVWLWLVAFGPLSAVPAPFSVLQTWHSELPLNHTGLRSDATGTQALLCGLGDVLEEAGPGLPAPHPNVG